MQNGSNQSDAQQTTIDPIDPDQAERRLSNVMHYRLEQVARERQALALDVGFHKAMMETIKAIHTASGIVAVMGNGGSAAEADHLVIHLMRLGIPAISLNANTTTLTALANDEQFDTIFSAQIRVLREQLSLVIALTTSDQSKNIQMGVGMAAHFGIPVIVLTGTNPQGASAKAQIVVRAPSRVDHRIQEVHTMVVHLIAEGVDLLRTLGGDANGERTEQGAATGKG